MIYYLLNCAWRHTPQKKLIIVQVNYWTAVQLYVMNRTRATTNCKVINSHIQPVISH